MPAGVIFALIAYAIYACSDSLIKGVGTSLSVYEISFFATVFSILPAMVTTPRGESWRHTFRMHHPYLVHLRAVAGLVSTICVVYAITHIPLAESYALVFLTPVFVVILSALVLRERVGWPRWVLLAMSFLGVLMVVQPGFRQLGLGHLAALCCAFCGAITVTVLRFVSEREKRVSLIGVVAAYALVFNAVMMAPTFRVPTLEQMVLLAGVGCCAGTGHILFIAATRISAANQMAPIQYTQMLWGVLFGAVIYREFPNLLAVAGLLVLLTAGIANLLLRGEKAQPLTVLAAQPPAQRALS